MGLESQKIPVTSCSHCGLPVPQGLLRPEKSEQFCCMACETVFGILSQNGLNHYYALREKFGDRQMEPPKHSKTFEHFDDPAFQSVHLHATPTGGSERSIELYLEGLHCAACVWLLEQTPQVLQGLRTVRVDFSRSLGHVTFEPSEVKLSTIATFFQTLGYRPHPYRSISRRDLRREEERRLLSRLGVAFIGAANAMMLAICLYSGLFSGISAEYSTLFRWFSLVLTTPVIFYSATAFYRGALAGLRVRKLAFDLPISLGLLAGYFFSVVNTIRGAGEVYFDSVCILVFLLLVSRWLQHRARKVSQEASEFLLSFLPSSARIVVDGNSREVPLEQITSGVVLEVLAHELIPVDGVVVSGSGWIDASLLTGESRPVAVGPSSKVHAGTQNLSSPLQIQTEASGEKTRIGRFLSVVDETIHRKAPVLQLVDRIAPRFTVVILALGALAFSVGFLSGDGFQFEEGCSRAVALLVVCCPCALAMATPLALAVNVGRAAKRGVYVKGGDVVERAAGIREIVFDKTGTLTRGEFRVLSWEGENTATLRRAVAALEKRSVHPVAQALVEASGVSGAELEKVEVSAVEELLGRGVRGKVEGVEIILGTESLLKEHGVEISNDAIALRNTVAARAETPILIGRDGVLVAIVGLGDPIRNEAQGALQLLRNDGYTTDLLSGDDRGVVLAVGSTLGFLPEQITGKASPEDKLQYIQARKNVLMVGDGVNDAGALAAATVGMAAHGGAEGSLVVSDVFLTKPDLQLIVEFLRSAKRTMRVIRRNLLFSLFYNVIGAALAVSGYLSPLGAAILMPLSSVSVFTSSMWNRSFAHTGNRSN